MTTPEAAYAEIERLVQKFKKLPAAQRRKYNEAATRQAFILPLFSALGWNITNPAEVSPEEKVSRGWVDFSFRIGGIPRFFLETKRIAEDLSKPRWVKQAVDYAWTKSVTWAVLSDFEGLRVLNAEWKEHNPLRAEFIRFDVDTYLSDFERLWWLSRPEMATGTLSREAEKVGKKARKQPVSQHLFDDLKTWRSELFRHLRVYNKTWSPAQIDAAVLRILNRLIFIRTAEDRRVEERRLRALLRELEDQGRIQQLPRELAQLFREFDATYNSELFAPHFSEKLDCEPEPFRVLINGLYEKHGGYVQYNFNAIDADVLGTAYEQYLGHVIADPEAAEVVAKRKKRKSQGIYYTPTFVVKYIVQQTLGRYLDEHGYQPHRPVRILDLACGSGSFLIESFDVLDRHLAQVRGQARGEQEDIIDYARRIEILSQNIYGVDKDEQAVAVARLNLMLKALHVRDQLPMLQNLRVGDSLISGAPDVLEVAFGEHWQDKKPFDWEAEFPKVMGEGGFDVVVGNPPYVRIQILPKDEVAFFKDQYRAATSSYDIYVLFVERALQLLKPGGVMGFILPSKFATATYGKGLRHLISKQSALTRYVDFVHEQVFEGATTYTCLLLLRNETVPHLSYGVVRSFEEAKLSRRLSDEHIEWRDWDATTYDSKPWNFAVGPEADLLMKLNEFENLGTVVESIFVGLQTSADDVYHLDDRGSATEGRRKLYSRALGKIVELESDIIHPLLSGSDVRRYGTLAPRQYVLFPYDVRAGKAELVSLKELKSRAPLAYQYLLDNSAVLKGRERGKFDDAKWYRFGRSQNLGTQGRRKICVPRLVLNIPAAFDEQGAFFLDNVDVGGVTLPHDDREQYLFLLALLNSRLLTFYLQRTSTRFRGGWYSCNKQYLSQLPIRCINFDDPAERQQHDAIVALAGEMLQLQKDHAEAERMLEDRRHDLKRRIEQVDAEIDRIVYELYGLTEKKIRLVEGVNT